MLKNKIPIYYHSALSKLNYLVQLALRHPAKSFLLLIPCTALTAFLILYLAIPLQLDKVTQWPTSPVLLDKENNIVHARLSATSEWSIPVKLEDMGKWLPLTAIAVEDKRFMSHPGVDPLALARATWQNLTSKRVISGASTITSQTIRISFPKERNLTAKLTEFIQALKLERELEKEQILEIYLNRAPFGGPIRGVEAASRLYFNKRAKDLSLGEASFLVALLKGPTAYRPDRNPDAAKKRRDYIINIVAQEYDLNPEITALAIKEPLPVFKNNMPIKAFHYAQAAFADKRNFSTKTLPSGTFPGAIESPLDSRIQAFLEFSLAESLAGLPPNLTASAGVVNNKSGELIAYVGNAKFNPQNSHTQSAHWVDCGQALRSPGSALKPFVYAQAFDSGSLIPASLMADTPILFGGKAPRNFDLIYRGPVTAHTALAESLNAPAVRTLRMVGGEETLNLLRRLGFKHLNRPFAHYGDSLILGGGEVSLVELLAAYSTLASLGEQKNISYVRTENSFDNATNMHVRELFSKESAWLVAETLKEQGRLDSIDRQVLSQNNMPIAFKTGTSYGLRDAWAIAYNPEYTVAVWFGDETGAPDPNLVGVQVAVPVILKVMRQLISSNSIEKNWYFPPKNIAYKEVCTLSGQAPGPFCPSTQVHPVISTVWRTEPCSLHVQRDGKIVLLWPPELENYVRLKNMTLRPNRNIYITSPVQESQFLLTATTHGQKIPLVCEGASGKLYWYVDKEYFASAEDGKRIFWPLSKGRHTISVLDENGNSAFVQITVTNLGEKLKK